MISSIPQGADDGAGIISALVVMSACAAPADRFCYRPGFIP
jgi:hypothetical protein